MAHHHQDAIAAADMLLAIAGPPESHPDQARRVYDDAAADRPPVRIQRQRTAGWRMPDGAVYVGRPSLWGNPFAIDGERAMWLAVAIGDHGGPDGRRRAAVRLFRWWIEGGDPAAFPVMPAPDNGGGVFEYSSGATARPVDLAQGLALRMAFREPLALPNVPDLAPLRGRDLACWCPLVDDAGQPVPCHADVLLERANQ